MNDEMWGSLALSLGEVFPPFSNITGFCGEDVDHKEILDILNDCSKCEHYLEHNCENIGCGWPSFKIRYMKFQYIESYDLIGDIDVFLGYYDRPDFGEAFWGYTLSDQDKVVWRTIPIQVRNRFCKAFHNLTLRGNLFRHFNLDPESNGLKIGLGSYLGSWEINKGCITKVLLRIAHYALLCLRELSDIGLQFTSRPFLSEGLRKTAMQDDFYNRF